jgi:hypothetical protein
MIMAKEETLRRLIQVEVEMIGADVWSSLEDAGYIMQTFFSNQIDNLSSLTEDEYDHLVSRLGSAFKTFGVDIDLDAIPREQQELLFKILNDPSGIKSLRDQDISLEAFTDTFSGLGGESELAELFGRLQHGGQTAEEILKEGLMGNRPKTAVEYLEAIWKALTFSDADADGDQANVLASLNILKALQVQTAQLAHITTLLALPPWDVSESVWMAELESKIGLVNLPEFAQGGIATSPSIFGEAGPEAAVPLPDGRTIPVTLSGQHMPPINLIAPEAGNSDELKAGLAELQRELHDLRIEQQRQHNASYRVQKDQLFIEEKREERGMPPTRQSRDQRATQQTEKEAAK